MDNDSDRVFLYDITESDQDKRLDIFLSSRSTGLSRSRIQALIKSGAVKVNDFTAKPSYKLRAGDTVLLLIPPPSIPGLEPRAIDFSIIHEESSLLVLNKPQGLVVHPAPGHTTDTLVNGLLHHCQDLSGIGGVLRPGIIHRLDKDTSGLMVVAKNDRAHAFLAGQFKRHEVKKQYYALTHGLVKGNKGKINLPIARHPTRRKEMSIALAGGRQALTLWEKIEEFQSGFSLLSISTKTGRTHQIRVHLSHMGHPVAGDPIYGCGQNWWKKHPLNKKGISPFIDGLMLHAKLLGFIHPDKGHFVEFEAPLPDHMANALRILRGLGS